MKWWAGEEAAGRQADSLPLGEGRRAAMAQRAGQVALFIGAMPLRRSPARERGPLWLDPLRWRVCAGSCCGCGGRRAGAPMARRRWRRESDASDPTPEKTILAKFGRRAAGSLAFLFWVLFFDNVLGSLVRQRQWPTHGLPSTGKRSSTLSCEKVKRWDLIILKDWA